MPPENYVCYNILNCTISNLRNLESREVSSIRQIPLSAITEFFSVGRDFILYKEIVHI
jgi:hypothetical protein